MVLRHPFEKDADICTVFTTIFIGLLKFSVPIQYFRTVRKICKVCGMTLMVPRLSFVTAVMKVDVLKSSVICPVPFPVFSEIIKGFYHLTVISSTMSWIFACFHFLNRLFYLRF